MTQMSNDSYGDGNVYRGQRSKDSVVKTITLAQQEPVMHTLNCVCGAVWDIKTDGSEEMVHTPLYTTPPQRTWVGLTDEQIVEHFKENVDTGSLLSFADGVRFAEAAHGIKEKEQEQEPVAWLSKGGKGIWFHEPDASLNATPLYTTPPPRKPLTDEQKVALCKQFPDHLTFNAIHAIEAAHGIKGDA